MGAAKKGGRLKKLVLLGFVGLFGVLALAFGGVYFASSSAMAETFSVEVATVTLRDDADTLERGKYLVDHVMGCNHSDCHRSDFGGGALLDAFPMGLIYAPNLTTGSGSKVKDYTTEDWLRVLRHGLKRDGTRALIMPSEDYCSFPDSDIAAVISYIKSQPPVDRESPDCAPGPLARALIAAGEIKFAYDKIDHKAERKKAEPGPTKEWGEVMAGACIGCHGEGFSGGKIPGTDPDWPAARNISPDEATGIGKWTFDDFQRALREGKRPDGSAISEVMPWKAYAGMTDDDIKALWEYLRTVPPKAEGGR
jgi:mono/diheme cytochrome c family protein